MSFITQIDLSYRAGSMQTYIRADFDIGKLAGPPKEAAKRR